MSRHNADYPQANSAEANMDHGAGSHGLMSGMFLAGVIFSLVPMIVTVAFSIFLYREYRASKRNP